MYKRYSSPGVTIRVKMIKPSELSKMNKAEKIIVNRVRLNSRLVEFEISNSVDVETIAIMTKAIKDMKMKEQKNLRPIMGAEMTVEDVFKVFDDVDALPENSFALIG